MLKKPYRHLKDHYLIIFKKKLLICLDSSPYSPSGPLYGHFDPYIQNAITKLLPNICDN